MYESQHNPNVGENQTHFGNGSGTLKGSAGVADGLSSIAKCDVKNVESVTQSQRPVARRESAGSYKIGT